jgi:hypothetical protein
MVTKAVVQTFQPVLRQPAGYSLLPDISYKKCSRWTEGMRRHELYQNVVLLLFANRAIRIRS